ncbi:acyl carrier protein [Deefgea piscis]|uniref:acyl carrier protein n=1 Tax=Deefgea piscis TaxID=2739061 RepID=UPI001C7E96BA|nr:acyl carrier protein [Deefgea piscis]QZA82542.1 acyl carrier protein [Deefgea piscis]
MEKKAIHDAVVNIIATLFEINPARITPDAQLYADLEIDSIDAVDMAAELKTLVGKKISPADFKQVRTVQDVIDTVDKLLQA